MKLQSIGGYWNNHSMSAKHKTKGMAKKSDGVKAKVPAFILDFSKFFKITLVACNRHDDVWLSMLLQLTYPHLHSCKTLLQIKHAQVQLNNNIQIKIRLLENTKEQSG